jgi:hypothetical protein
MSARLFIVVLVGTLVSGGLGGVLKGLEGEAGVRQAHTLQQPIVVFFSDKSADVQTLAGQFMAISEMDFGTAQHEGGGGGGKTRLLMSNRFRVEPFSHHKNSKTGRPEPMVVVYSDEMIWERFEEFMCWYTTVLEMTGSPMEQPGTYRLGGMEGIRIKSDVIKEKLWTKEERKSSAGGPINWGFLYETGWPRAIENIKSHIDCPLSAILGDNAA